MTADLAGLTKAPAFAEATGTTSSAPMLWYAGGVILDFAGRFTHNCTPWNSPPEITRSSGGVSMCRMPAPAVIHLLCFCTTIFDIGYWCPGAAA
jgi:hypothetical protein